MNIRGGRTFYGQDIGILMMDTKFPRIPGDPGNAATFDFPVCYKPTNKKSSAFSKNTNVEMEVQPKDRPKKAVTHKV